MNFPQRYFVILLGRNQGKQDLLMVVLPLQQGIIYGPISSRRFGMSLGINLLPTDMKVCSFNCIYCHYGWTFLQTEDAAFISDSFPTKKQVEKELEEALRNAANEGRPPDVITFSGNGEPTLHPEFSEIVDSVMSVRDRLEPSVPVQILCNSTFFSRKATVEGLRKLDRKVMKLDAGNQDLIEKINRPMSGFGLKTVAESMKLLGDIHIQSAFMTGRIDNSGDDAVADWLNILEKIKPLQVQIYTLDRPPADSALERVAKPRLEDIASRVRAAGLAVTVF
jgi:wyosine [tRNA(Phe)-imidazoG37] synthetase (radical SAM superfamily)